MADEDLTARDYYHEKWEEEPEEITLGRAIYREALGHRRGFRPDQIGIELDDEVWHEIFDAIGRAAIDHLAGDSHG